MGLTKDESSRYQQLAAMPAKKMTQADQRRLQDLNAAKARGTSMLSTYARLLLQALRE